MKNIPLNRPSGQRSCLRMFTLIALAVSGVVRFSPDQAVASNPSPVAEPLRAGASQISFALPVWIHIPEDVQASKAPILIVMHGARRNADRYRDQWIDAANAEGLIVVAPAFSRDDFPNAAGYNLGAVFEGDGTTAREESLWAFSAIEPLFDHIVASLDGAQTHYSIYGHSAGSQFVHRFLFFKPDARVKRYIAANAGWYTFADPAIAFPFGLGGLEISEEAIQQALAKDVIIALGDKDSDPNSRLLNKSEGAMRQGPHRYARGQAFFAAAKALATEKGWKFGWSKREVKGVAHSNGDMASRVADLVR